MHRLPDELRLFVLLAVNTLVLFACVRFARRRGVRDGPQIALDAMLLWYAVQYVAVGLPGLLGILSFASMYAVAIAISVAFMLTPAARTDEPTQPMRDADRRVLMACCALICAFIIAVVWNQRLAPPLANDALTYHLPAAVQWLQTGRLGLFETWYFNPANTYSPLAGSMFIAWLMAPLSNDVLAQFVEASALVMIFFATLLLARSLGANLIIASLIALATCAARPFISQTVLTKDDLFVTAFFATTVVALDEERLRDRLGSWRLGLAAGLLLSTKYTALLSVPIFLLAWDAPRRAGWHRNHHITAFVVALLLAGPWYLRNAVLTGNPLFPIDVSIGPVTLLRGMFGPMRATQLGDFGGIATVLFHSYASLPQIAAFALLALWTAAFVRLGRQSVRLPIERLVLFGPLIGIALFVTLSPYAEVRFVYPSFLLLFATAAITLGWLQHYRVSVLLAAGLVVLSISTSFDRHVLVALVSPAECAVVVVLMIALIIEITRRSARQRFMAAAALAAVLLAGVYVYWHAYLGARRLSERNFWWRGYGDVAHGWTALRDQEMPPGTIIAYANTHYTYPLMGRDLDRRIVYVPTRPAVHSIADLGRLDAPVTGEELPLRLTELMQRGSDRSAWLQNLRESHARYVVIERPRRFPVPTEFGLVRGDSRFVRILDEDDVAVYEVRW